jgi:hypothetical protein
MTSIRFYHGLGDSANFAHIIKLYTDAGETVEVETDASKTPLFLAAGAKITKKGEQHHPYPHAPAPGRPQHLDHWSGSKVAWNVSGAPMPNIGGYWERWADLCAVKLSLDTLVPAEERERVSAYFRQLPRPIVLFHSQGNTGTESKNLAHEEQAKLIRGLLDRTEGSVILLDWDQRAYRLNNYRVRHLTDDWHGLNTFQLYEAIKQADLLIGIDSGPLHFARFTDTPAVGVWTHHFPSHFALPRRETLNVVPASKNEWTRYRRIAFNIVECPGDRQDGSFIAEQAVRMLEQPRYLTRGTKAQDCTLRGLVDKLRTFDAALTSFVDRHRSFDALFKLATERGLLRWVETGCIRAPEDWTAGFSTYIFGLYLMHQGGELESVDLNGGNCNFAREWTQAFGTTVKVLEQHSHDYLKARREPIDVFYTDSADVGTDRYQECCLEECRLALPLLHDRSLVLFDDSCWGKGSFQGKGAKAIPWLMSQGWRVVYGGYQVLMSR